MRDELTGTTLLSDLIDETSQEKNVGKQQMEFSTPIEQVMDSPDTMQPQRMIQVPSQKSSGYPMNLNKKQMEALVAGVAAVIGFSEVVQGKILDMIPQALNESGKLSAIGMVVMVLIVAVIFYFLKQFTINR